MAYNLLDYFTIILWLIVFNIVLVLKYMFYLL